MSGAEAEVLEPNEDSPSKFHKILKSISSGANQIYEYFRTLMINGFHFGGLLAFLTFFGQSIYKGYEDECPYFYIFLIMAAVYLLLFLGLFLFTYFYLGLSPETIICEKRSFDNIGNIFNTTGSDLKVFGNPNTEIPVAKPKKVPPHVLAQMEPIRQPDDDEPLQQHRLLHIMGLRGWDVTKPWDDLTDPDVYRKFHAPNPVPIRFREKKEKPKPKKRKLVYCQCRGEGNPAPKPVLIRPPVQEFFRIGDDCM